MLDVIEIAGESNWIAMSQPMMIVENMSPRNDLLRKNVYDPVKKMVQAKYGLTKELSVFHGSFWEGTAGVVEAMKMAPTIDRARIRDALRESKTGRFSRDLLEAVVESPGCAHRSYEAHGLEERRVLAVREE